MRVRNSEQTTGHASQRQTGSTLHSGPTFFLRPRHVRATRSATTHGQDSNSGRECNHATDGELMSSDKKEHPGMQMCQKVGYFRLADQIFFLLNFRNVNGAEQFYPTSLWNKT